MLSLRWCPLTLVALIAVATATEEHMVETITHEMEVIHTVIETEMHPTTVLETMHETMPE